MTDYARIGLSVEVSPNSDYSDAVKPKIEPWELTPTEGPGWQYIAATTAGGAANTINLDTLTAAARATLVVKNRDTTNFVSITCRLMGDADDAVLRVHADEITVVSIDPVTDLIFDGDTATVNCMFMVIQ